MALQFKPLKLADEELFGVGLSGSVSRSDSQRIKELADKCLLNGKVKVVLDFSDLSSMGGGGARMIAELQDRLAEAKGAAVIAGAGDTVKRFLNQTLESRSISYCATVEEAIVALGGDAPVAGLKEPVTEETLEQDKAEVEELLAENLDSDDSNDPEETMDVGAVGFHDDHDDETTAELDDLLGEFKVSETPQGRRKDHHYTSLAEALSVLGNWSDRQSQMDFSEALKNLLFSQGLAEDVTMLVAQGGLLISPDGYKELPLDGSLALQVEEMARPLTMLDVMDDGLEEEEISLLEALDPDILLPVLRHEVLSFLVLIKKGGDEREYSVAESFAFELLQQILESNEEARTAPPLSRPNEEVPTDKVLQGVATLDGDVSSIMLRMALDMPEADDLPHFWRLFARHVQSEMQLNEMAFLPAGRNHPQIMLGGDESLMGLDCSEERLQKYFQTMERPVHIANLPDTFADMRKELKANRANWVVALHWDEEYLGTLFVNGSCEEKGVFPDSLIPVFSLASRLLVRFEDQNDDADVYLELIFRLMSQREKRFFGSDAMTISIVEQLSSLALEMGFPPDQKRDLIYGCLLRDMGLIDKDDALMGSPAEMTPSQWKSYRNHPSEGMALLNGLNLSTTALEVVKCHHERFNGEGFPAGLSGRDIPLAARVVTVVENFVAMTTGAGGLEPKSAEQAAEVLRENLGERYDPDIVGIFLSVVEKSGS